MDGIKEIHANYKHKKNEMAILNITQNGIQDKNITRDKQGYFIMIKCIIHQEDIMIINMCISINRASKYMYKN